LVEGDLVRARLNGQGDLGLLRQLFQHVGLPASQQERQDQLMKGRAHRRRTARLKWPHEASLEALLAAQEARIGEAKQAPQVEQMILDRRACGREAVASRETTGGASALAARVLDRLRLVEHGQTKVDPGETRALALHLAVARDQEIALAEVGQLALAILFTEADHPHSRAEA